jgi:histidyl-tRNA synthetase
MVKALASGEQAPMPLAWIPQGVADLLFEDVLAHESNDALPSLAERLARP